MLAALLLTAAASAEPLWGEADILSAGEAAALPGAWLHPFNDYGGDAAPELFAGVGLSEGINLWAGTAVEVPLYEREVDDLHGEAHHTELSEVEVAARWYASKALGVGARINDHHGDWGAGPELNSAAHLGHLALVTRAAWIYFPGREENDLGHLSMAVALAGHEDHTLSWFLEAEPGLEVIVGHDEETGEGLASEFSAPLRAGGWLRLEPTGHHRVAAALGYTPHAGGHPERDMSVGLRYRVGFGDEHRAL